jgi:deoxyribonuclease V
MQIRQVCRSEANPLFNTACPSGGYARADSTRTTLSDLPERLLRTSAGGGPDPLSLLTRVRASSRYEHRHTPDRGLCAAVDVQYLSTGGARAAAVLAADAVFAHVLAERTGLVPQVAPYQPGEFYRRELPPLRAVLDDLDDLGGLGLLVVDGYADLDSAGRPGLGAHAHAEFGIPVIGVAKSRFRTATHAVPVLRGSSARPLFVTAAGMPAADAADLV